MGRLPRSIGPKAKAVVPKANLPQRPRTPAGRRDQGFTVTLDLMRS